MASTPEQKKDRHEKLSDASIKRLARKGGVKRISEASFDVVRKTINVDIDTWLKHSIAFTVNRKAKTVNLDDLQNGAKSMKKYLAFAGKSNHAPSGKGAEGKVHQDKVESYNTHKKKTSEPRKTDRKFHPGTVAQREIKYYQKHADQYVLSHAAFGRLVRSLASDNVRFTEEVLYVLQEVIESEIVKVFEHANLVAGHANRVTVTHKDLAVSHIVKTED